MGQRVTKVSPMKFGEVYDQHPSTPPKPSTNTELQHPHPRDESPVDASLSVSKFVLFYLLTDYIFSRYTIGDQLGKGGCGVVYEGRRLNDDLKVALKYVMKTQHTESIFIPDHPKPLPKEIALTILANKGPSVPEIIRLLDWTDHPDHFVMVLECPSPCESLVGFIRRHGGRLEEETTRQIMWQTAHAANVCHLRGVFHRDVKLDNLLINRETSEVKLIDFGCGDILRRTPYRSYSGTAVYSPPEYHNRGKYYGGPATVWSLGIVMFAMLCGRFPSDLDLFLLQCKRWPKPGLSKECGDLLRALLHEKPSRRIGLGRIMSHSWSSHKTTPAGVSCAALRLAGCSRRHFHPSSRLCVLRGEKALRSVLHLGFRKQYLRLALPASAVQMQESPLSLLFSAIQKAKDTKEVPSMAAPHLS
ncbi:serine/threonine-protein kinase pim-1-like [Carassius auratus]|uniref:non-specific serine/threonine protein kinase n=1 Tax=Carassius auratus TaxID=7957 RepID=A0A6P6JAZ4_CARAU|nr:serine/threonine-protein kinase pim-1-like [Carassius auratus]